MYKGKMQLTQEGKTCILGNPILLWLFPFSYPLTQPMWPLELLVCNVLIDRSYRDRQTEVLHGTFGCECAFRWEVPVMFNLPLLGNAWGRSEKVPNSSRKRTRYKGHRQMECLPSPWPWFKQWRKVLTMARRWKDRESLRSMLKQLPVP